MSIDFSKLQEIEQQLLEERAANLAKPLETEQNLQKERPLLVFNALSTRFALPLNQVEGVTRIHDIIPIPHTPPHIPGVIRRRGQTTALVKLRHFFHPGQEGLIDEDFAVVVTGMNKTFAFQVEDVEGVIHLPENQIRTIPDSYDEKVVPYLDGVTLDGLALLNLNRIIRTEGFGTTKIEE